MGVRRGVARGVQEVARGREPHGVWQVSTPSDAPCIIIIIIIIFITITATADVGMADFTADAGSFCQEEELCMGMSGLMTRSPGRMWCTSTLTSSQLSR